MPRTTESTSILKPGLDALGICRGLTAALVEAIPDEKLTVRACPDSNHAAYILGHIARTDDWVLGALGGPAPALPESWRSLFDGGATTSEDRSAYPSKRELLDAMTSRRRAVTDWLVTLTPEELLEPVSGDLAQIVPTRAAFPSSAAFHEGFHAGQLSTIRRALGIPRLF